MGGSRSEPVVSGRLRGFTLDPAIRVASLLDADRKLVIIADDEATGGERKITLTWPEPPADEHLARALNPLPAVRIDVGETRYARRWTCGRWTFWFHKMSGPPTWWWPRCFIHQRSLVVGWLWRAVAIKIARTALERDLLTGGQDA